MPGRLPQVTAEQVRRALLRAGWYEVRRVGSHVQLRRDDRPEDVTLAMHRGDVPPGTLKSIMRQAGLTREQLREIL